MVSPSVNAAKAERLEEWAITYFNENYVSLAIDAYTTAIDLCPNVPRYWTSRALCYQELEEWAKVEKDCLKAINLDQNSVTGHYLLGLALLQKKENADGIKELQKALDLERSGNPPGPLVKEIWEELAKEKYKEWELAFPKRVWDLRCLKGACEDAIRQQHALAMSQDPPDEEAASYLSKQLETLERVFQRAGEDDRATEVPDYLCCEITLEIFRDPVVAPSGVTYERAAILEHLDKVGKFDPSTREPLEQNQLVQNLAIKEAVAAYLDRHGWAYKTT